MTGLNAYFGTSGGSGGLASLQPINSGSSMGQGYPPSNISSQGAGVARMGTNNYGTQSQTLNTSASKASNMGSGYGSAMGSGSGKPSKPVFGGSSGGMSSKPNFLGGNQDQGEQLRKKVDDMKIN